MMITGIQTEVPFKRSMQPSGGIRIAQQICLDYGDSVDEDVQEIFGEYRKTHNEGVFEY